MKKLLVFLLILVLLAGCTSSPKTAVKDGRARPSACGQLQVVNGKLCAEDGEPVGTSSAAKY